MAGIAGIALPGRQQDVVQMLEKISHRGKDRAKMLEKKDTTMQAAWPEVQELLAEHAESAISDEDFQGERTLPNGWKLNSKEELMYYRIFKEHFGELSQLDWMGRTKGAPVH